MNISSSHTDFAVNDYKGHINFINPSRFKKSLGLDLFNLVRYEKYFQTLLYQGKVINKIRYTDLDDTLLSRRLQLEEDRFAKNRGEAGNRIVFETIGVNNFYHKYYNKEMVCKEILKRTDCILTAGNYELQEGKMIQTELDSIDRIIVDKHSMKPRAILHDIINKGIYLREIVLYDDKSFSLIDDFLDLSELLRNRIVLHNISLSKDKYNELESDEIIIIEDGQIIDTDNKKDTA